MYCDDQNQLDWIILSLMTAESGLVNPCLQNTTRKWNGKTAFVSSTNRF